MPCNCVLRAIFRSCYVRFRLCLAKEKRMSHARFEIIGGPERRAMWGRRDEEYVADFCLVSRRALNDYEYRIFRLHFLLGADWKLCCRQLNMERGAFFHDIYRIEQKLGRAFREVEPYSLFPLSDYFAPVVKKERTQSVTDEGSLSATSGDSFPLAEAPSTRIASFDAIRPLLQGERRY